MTRKETKAVATALSAVYVMGEVTTAAGGGVDMETGHKHQAISVVGGRQSSPASQLPRSHPRHVAASLSFCSTTSPHANPSVFAKKWSGSASERQ